MADQPQWAGRSGLALAAARGGSGGQNVSGQPNVTLTSQDNPIVNVLQLGADGLSATLKDQHITSSRPTDTGPGVSMEMNPGRANGLNQAGGSARVGAGDSTGSGASGIVAFTLPTPGPAGAGLNVAQDRLYLVDVAGLSVLYPALLNNGYLGLASNPFAFAYIINLLAAGGAGFWGHAVPAAQPAAPVTLADVIAIIRGCGLSA